MKLSTKGRYGLRALIDLAMYSEKEAVSISSIAARQNISESYLEQLVGKLKKAGIVLSIRGAQGGYKLAKPASDISVGDTKICAFTSVFFFQARTLYGIQIPFQSS